MEPSSNAYHVCIKDLQTDTSIPRDSTKDIRQTINAHNFKIVWLAELGKELPLPKFDREIAYYEIYSSSLHLIFWKVILGKDSDDLHSEI